MTKNRMNSVNSTQYQKVRGRDTHRSSGKESARDEYKKGIKSIKETKFNISH